MLVTHLSLHTQGHQHHILPSRPIGVQCSRVCVTGMERREWNYTPMPNFLSAYTHHTPFFCRSQSLFVRMSTTDLPPSIHHTPSPPTTTIRRRALAIARQGPLMRAAPFYSLSRRRTNNYNTRGRYSDSSATGSAVRQEGTLIARTAERTS